MELGKDINEKENKLYGEFCLGGYFYPGLCFSGLGSAVVQNSRSFIWTQGWRTPALLFGHEALKLNDKPSVTSPGSPNRSSPAGNHLSQERLGSAVLHPLQACLGGQRLMATRGQSLASQIFSVGDFSASFR